MTNEIIWMTALELSQKIKARELSASEVADAMISRIEEVNPKINAVIDYDPNQIRSDAAALDNKYSADDELPLLHGIPYTIKDLTAVAGRPTTMGIRSLKDNVVDHDAPIVERLKKADGLFLGKTNTPEAGYCGKTTNHLFGATRNPWNLEMSAGGSSGGAGAAVAAGIGALAEGSDGGGSIRVPAAFNGIVGFKPSTGRIPQNMMASRFATNVFQGPLTRSVGDAALMLDATVGEDARDPLSLPHPGFSYVEALDGGIEGWRIAYSPDLGFGDVDPEVADIVHTAVEQFKNAGAIVVDATPKWGYPDDAMWEGVWVPGYAGMSDVFDLDAMKDELDEELIQLIRDGDKLTVTDYAKADAVRSGLYDTFQSFMQDFEILASPTTMIPTFPVTRFSPERLDGQPLRRRLLGWSLTHPFNMTTTPAISVPCGFTKAGLPVGLQLAGRYHRDEEVLRAAKVFEELAPWAEKHPEI